MPDNCQIHCSTEVRDALLSCKEHGDTYNDILVKMLNEYDEDNEYDPNEIVPDYRNPDILEELYWGDEKLSTYEIAKKFDVSSGVIRNWMVEHEIERRSLSEASKKNPKDRLDAILSEMD